jgi:hypothetical protein
MKMSSDELFFACRVLFTKPGKVEYIVIQGHEIPRRQDVEVASKGFVTEEAAVTAIEYFGGDIPDKPPMFLDFWEDEYGETVWCWKDDRTFGASQVFGSEKEALEAWNNNLLEFDALLD